MITRRNMRRQEGGRGSAREREGTLAFIDIWSVQCSRTVCLADIEQGGWHGFPQILSIKCVIGTWPACAIVEGQGQAHPVVAIGIVECGRGGRRMVLEVSCWVVAAFGYVPPSASVPLPAECDAIVEPLICSNVVP